MKTETAELEKNELADWVEKKLGSYRPHTNLILLGLLAAMVLMFVLGYWFNLREAAKSEPWRLLQSAQINSRLTSQTSEYEQVFENYPDSMAGLWAMQLSGDADLRIGLNKMVSDREGALKQIDRARKSLEKIGASTLPGIPELLKERSLFSLGYALESLGKFDDAKKVYGRLLTELPDATMTVQAKEALARLESPEWTSVFEKFAAVGTAPDMKLPAIPDISFPE